jgi:bifunctional DNase/RNase
MVEVVIDSVRVSLTNQQRIVVLRETTTERYLPIWIGPYEAEAITIALQEIEVARPQSHDLMKNILTTLNARLLRIEVVSLKEDVFYGNLVVEVDGRTIFIDSRPSDALALAARARVPILISREVMDSAGVVPEEDLQNQRSAPQPPARQAAGDEPEAEGASERLSVFEDFLQNLDLDNLEKNDDEDPDDDAPKPGKS